jgi:hypothetical protein
MTHPFRPFPIEAPPREPRAMSLVARAQLVLGGGGLTWSCLAMIALVLAVMAPDVRWTAPSYPHAAPGRVVDVDEDVDEGSTSYQVEASFVDDDGRRRTVTSTSGDRSRVGDPVTVDFGPDDARIHGMADHTVSPAVVAFVAIFLFAVAGLSVRDMIRSLRTIRLLRTGTVARGQLIARETISVSEGPDETRLTFELVTDDGTVRRCEARTARPALLEDEPTKPVVYDPRWPDHATLLDHLPGRPRIDADDRVHVAGGVLVFGRPLLAAALLIVAVVRLV